MRDAVAPNWRDERDADDPAVADAEAYLSKHHGTLLVPQMQMCANPHALFSVRGDQPPRAFLAELELAGDKHFAVYCSNGLFGDNLPHVIPITIVEKDLAGGNETAIAAMLGLWGGAVKTARLVNAYELVRP